MTRTILSAIFCLSFTLLSAQKKAITHDDYDLWKSISNTNISANGKLVVSTIKTETGRGDGYLHIYNTETKKEITFFNGMLSSITHDEKFVVFQQPASYLTKRTEKKEKVKAKNKQKDVLYIYDAQHHQLYDSILNVKKYTLPKKSSNYVVIEKYKNTKDSLKRDTLPAWKNDYALVYHLKTKTADTIFHIKNVVVPEEGTTFYYTTKNKQKKKKAFGVYKYDTASQKRHVIDTGLHDYKKLAVNKQGNLLAYLAERDSIKTDSVPFKLFLYKNNELKSLVSNETLHFGENQTLTDHNELSISEDGKRLYFYTKLKSIYKKDTTLIDDEIPQVDVWNWQDKITQPRQKALEKQLKEDTRLFYYNIEKDSYVRLQDDVIDAFEFNDEYVGKYIIGRDAKPYQIQTWATPWKNDYYVVELATGKKRLFLKETRSSVMISYDGKYGVYFDFDTKDWFSVNLETLQKINLTKNINVSFEDEENDKPNVAYPYGIAGYDLDGNLLIKDKYDIWKVALNGKIKPKNITKNGRTKNIEYDTFVFKDQHPFLATHVDGKLLLKAFDFTKKADGIYLLGKRKLIEKIKPEASLINALEKAASNDVFVFRKGNFQNYYDVHVTTNKFNSYTKITDVNSHAKNFKWGTSELVTWTAFDGTKLEGIVYKPEDFDPTKKYPMIVYFYERSSDELNRHFIPKPSASTVNKTYLSSNGYITFVPDIVYQTGQPGKDAYNCVISGVEMMEQQPYIDSERMALQGQSWGGYQVAYLITKTNKFKAAMAGAPVSNMTSAYGGIRWSSGLSRMFQYERTQSRIGKTLWEGFDQYVESSPLFSLPSVQTPLLIMHNDNDGAVPYYQGIELFMGMRRLQKPAWLLVYNDESHNLRKMKNKQDLSIRMMQFFDHYLKDAPAPKWMTEGVPRNQKGINFGYELEDEKP